MLQLPFLKKFFGLVDFFFYKESVQKNCKLKMLAFGASHHVSFYFLKRDNLI